MGILEWLILSFGAFGVVHGSKCAPETAECSPYWVQIEPHRNLMESKTELNSWCRKQSLFYRCMENVLLGIYGNYSKFPTNMLVSQMFSEDLCLEGSTSRQRYLDNAACINQLDLEYCTLPEYLEIVTPDGSIPPTKCSLAEKTFSCIAATMVMRCGFDAARVYRYLLKVNKYGQEVCGVKDAEGATCEEVSDSELSEIYYGLLHRFGRLPEQATEVGSLDEQKSFLSEKFMISDAIKNESDTDSSEDDASSTSSAFDYDKVIRNKDEFRKRPIITEPFKGFLFYNYSNEEFEFYWRQPSSIPIHRVTCNHNKVTSDKNAVWFVCTFYYRYDEPECGKHAVEEKITPELIRDIDLTIPEDSTLHISKTLDWTGYLKDYTRHKMSWELFLLVKMVSEKDYMREVNEEFVTEYPNSEVCFKELRYYDVLNDKSIDWWQCPSLFSDELRNEILTFLFRNRTRDKDSFVLTSINWKEANGETVTYVELFEPVFHGIEKIVCERVNECHPRGRGVFKCSLERRGIEGCDTCCVQFPYQAELCLREESTQSEVVGERESSEILNSSREGSVALDDNSPREAKTSMENDESTESTEESTNLLTAVIDESEDVLIVDITELPDKSNYFSSDAGLMFLRQISHDSTEESFVEQPEATLSVSDGEAL